MILATVMYAAFFVVIANAVVDLVYAWLDPRVALPEPLLDMRDLRVAFRTEEGLVHGRRRALALDRAGEVRRHRRRVGLRQDRLDAGA